MKFGFNIGNKRKHLILKCTDVEAIFGGVKSSLHTYALHIKLNLGESIILGKGKKGEEAEIGKWETVRVVMWKSEKKLIVKLM